MTMDPGSRAPRLGHWGFSVRGLISLGISFVAIFLPVILPFNLLIFYQVLVLDKKSKRP